MLHALPAGIGIGWSCTFPLARDLGHAGKPRCQPLCVNSCTGGLFATSNGLPRPATVTAHKRGKRSFDFKVLLPCSTVALMVRQWNPAKWLLRRQLPGSLSPHNYALGRDKFAGDTSGVGTASASPPPLRFGGLWLEWCLGGCTMHRQASGLNGVGLGALCR